MPRIRASTIAEHKSQTRAEILDAAAALFKGQGYLETSLGDLAGYVGIGRTTLYEYFTDKEDVLASLVEDRIPRLIDRLLDGIASDASAPRQLTQLMIRSLEFISNDEDLGTLLMRETPRLSTATQQRIRRSHGRLLDEITSLCARGMESGEFRAFEPKEAGRLVYSVMWSASQTLLRERDPAQRRHEVAETVVRFILEGLAA